MVKLSSNKNTVLATTSNSGIGKTKRANLANNHVHTGSANNPATATNFKAMPYGNTMSSNKMKIAGTTM